MSLKNSSEKHNIEPMNYLRVIWLAIAILGESGCVDQPTMKPPPSQQLHHFTCQVWRSCAGSATVDAPRADVFVPTDDPQEAEIQWVGWCESQTCDGGLSCHAGCELAGY